MRASRLLMFEQSTQGQGFSASQSTRDGSDAQVVLSPDAQKVQVRKSFSPSRLANLFV